VLRAGDCPACGASLFVRYANDETAVRCLRCRATPVTLSLIQVLREIRPDLSTLDAYELSSRGALARFLHKRVKRLTTSEYLDDVPLGESRSGIQCQDVMQLTFADRSFDLCTSTEVFEHVPDDAKGFREVHRVLRPGGVFLFTVPMKAGKTLVRATATKEGIVHHLEPEYHSDRLRGSRKVLCYRTYGEDVVERLQSAGFATRIASAASASWFGFHRPVIVGVRAP
jgi:SAM-dependent methyltransferase